MQIQVRVIPNAKKSLIKNGNSGLKVYLTAPAVEGKANQALIESLADYFKTRKNRIQIIRGLKSRDKIVEIPNERDKNAAGSDQ